MPNIPTMFLHPEENPWKAQITQNHHPAKIRILTTKDNIERSRDYPTYYIVPTNTVPPRSNNLQIFHDLTMSMQHVHYEQERRTWMR